MTRLIVMTILPLLVISACAPRGWGEHGDGVNLDLSTPKAAMRTMNDAIIAGDEAAYRNVVVTGPPGGYKDVQTSVWFAAIRLHGAVEDELGVRSRPRATTQDRAERLVVTDFRAQAREMRRQLDALTLVVQGDDAFFEHSRDRGPVMRRIDGRWRFTGPADESRQAPTDPVYARRLVAHERGMLAAIEEARRAVLAGEAKTIRDVNRNPTRTDSRPRGVQEPLMAQTKQQIQALLADAGSSPRHRFGQNFMIDGNLVRLVADAGAIAAGDVVIEVGPGTGTLTEELLSRGAAVVAVEIDRDLAAMLRARHANNARFTLIEGDALAGKHELNAALLEHVAGVHSAAGAAAAGRRLKLVANLPYNIASPLVIELLIAGVELLVFTVQKEVADRLRAQADSDDYGPLTVMAQLLGNVEVLRTLPPQAFWPAPKIDSALVRMTRADQLGPDAPAVGRFVQQLFAARRKTLRKALSQMGLDGERLLAALGIDPQLRPERLTPRQCLELFRLAGREQAHRSGAAD